MTAYWQTSEGDPASLRRDSSVVVREDYFDGGMLGLSWLALDGTILWANRADYEALGYAPDDFIGRRIHDFHVVPGGADALLQRLAAGENVKHHEAVLRRSDGSPQPVTISGRARFDEQGRFLHAMCCTQEGDAPGSDSVDVRADRRSLTLLASVSRAIVDRGLQLDGLDDIFERIARDVTEVLGDCCAIHLLSDDPHWLSLRVFYHRAQAARSHVATHGATPLAIDCGICARVLGEDRPLRLANVSLETLSELYGAPCANDFFTQFMAHSLLVVPLRIHDKQLGMLAVWRESSAPYSDADELLLGDLADRIALAIRLAEQHTELSAERQRLRAVLEQMPSAVAIFEAQSGRPVLMNDQNAHIFRSSDPLAQLTRGKGEGPALPLQRALLRGETVHGEEICIERGDGTTGTIRINAAPVVDDRGQRVAAVVSYDDITEQKAMVDAVHHSNEQLRRIAEASDLFALSLDYERTLDHLTKLTIPALGDLGFFDVYEGEAVRRVTYVHERPEVKALLEQTAWIDCAPAALGLSALSTGRAHIQPDIDETWVRQAATTPHDLSLLRELDLRSMLSVPLTHHGQIIGAMTLFFGWSGRRYEPQDLALAEELSRRAASALVNARLFREAREAIGVRDDFLSLAGHELRTPLTALQLQILSISKMLGQPDALDKIGGRADKAARNVLRLSNLVNELLDISRISAGRLRLERSNVALDETVRSVLSRQEEEISKSGCAISLEAPDAITGHWDRERIEQVITNLLVNAMKYGKGKPIELAVARGEGVARLTVRDHGIGISPEDQQRIFQRFERAVSSRHFGGLGLGLWIARQLVDAHGGTIRVSSEEDRGATFEVTLPLAPLEEVQT